MSLIWMPAHTTTPPGVPAIDNLVTGHDGDRGIREFSVDEVEVGAANRARENLHKNVR